MAGGKPIDVVINTDVDGVIQGAGKVADSFEDIQDSLKDTAKASDKASDGIEDDFKDAAKVIDRDLTKALDEVEDQAKTTGKSVGKSVKDGTDRASEGFEDMRSEAASTATESAASFGSIEDAAGALQEALANSLAGFGPVGAAVGIAAAIGVGMLTSALEDNADKINENKEKMLSLAQTIKDNGGVLRESDLIQAMDDFGFAVQDSKEWFELFQKDAVSGFEQIRDGAEKAGVGIGDAFKGQFGSLKDSKLVLADLEKGLADLESQTKDNATVVDDFGRTLDTTDPAIRKQIDGNKELTQKVRDHIKELEAAKEIERIRKEAIQGTTQALKEDIEALEKRTDAMKGSITSELDYLDGAENLTTQLAESKNAWDINTAAGRENRRSVLDQASAIEDMAKASIDAGDPVDSVTAKFNAQKDALINQVTPAFGGSKEAARQYIEQVLKTPPSATTTVKLAGEADVRAGLDRLSRPVSVLLKPEAPSETYFQGVLAQLSGRSVPVTLTPRLGSEKTK